MVPALFHHLEDCFQQRCFLFQLLMGTSGACWTLASTRWWFGPKITSHPCAAAALAWSLIPQSVTSPSPKFLPRGWKRSKPKGVGSPRTSSCECEPWGCGSCEPAPKPSTAAGRSSSSWRPGEPPEPGGLWRTDEGSCPDDDYLITKTFGSTRTWDDICELAL